MTAILSPTEWESTAALVAHVESNDGQVIILGKNAEAPRRFYTFSCESKGRSIAVALLSSGLGPKPSLARFEGGLAIVGYDAALAPVDLVNVAAMPEQRLGGAFFEFISLPGTEDVLVLHELGALRFAPDGGVRWSADTEIVVESKLSQRGELLIREMDQEGWLAINVENGSQSTL